MNSEVIVHGDIPAGVRFDSAGLVPVIVHEYSSKKVLMLAWMDQEALNRTISERRVTYYSRSRQEYWRKGDSSGNIQWARSLSLDCDHDAVLLEIDQVGVACHTGAHSCFEADHS
jgi:phosphoribosyl-AMP cyclohydrolase